MSNNIPDILIPVLVDFDLLGGNENDDKTREQLKNISTSEPLSDETINLLGSAVDKILMSNKCFLHGIDPKTKKMENLKCPILRPGEDIFGITTKSQSLEDQ